MSLTQYSIVSLWHYFCPTKLPPGASAALKKKKSSKQGCWCTHFFTEAIYSIFSKTVLMSLFLKAQSSLNTRKIKTGFHNILTMYHIKQQDLSAKIQLSKTIRNQNPSPQQKVLSNQTTFRPSRRPERASWTVCVRKQFQREATMMKKVLKQVDKAWPLQRWQYKEELLGRLKQAHGFI